METNEFTRGIYLHDGFIFEPKEMCPFYWKYEDWQRYIDWLSSIGINAVEFATQAAFLRLPSTSMELERIGIMKKVIKYAHQKGIKVWYLVASNVLSNVPEGMEPVDQGESGAYREPCPQVPENRRRILETATYFIEQYEGIDAYELFAGDWGGCQCGKCDYHTYMELCGEYYKAIRKVNPAAEVFLDTWCVSYWRKFDASAMDWKTVFDEEAAYSKKVLEALADMPPDVGIALPFHHLYRPLAISGRDENQCPSWPGRTEAGKLHECGRKMIAWPHFIMENDPMHYGRWGYMNARLAYLRDLVVKLKSIGLDGIMGNLYNPQSQPLMAYAFARMTGPQDTADEKILFDFASLLAEGSDAEKLYEVLAFMENNDPWEADLPVSWRKRHVDCKIDRKKAVEIMEGIKAREEVPICLQLSPAGYLEVIRSTLESVPDAPLTGSLA